MLIGPVLLEGVDGNYRARGVQGTTRETRYDDARMVLGLDFDSHRRPAEVNVRFVLKSKRPPSDEYRK